MHPWPVFTPEANYTTITSGAGAGPTLAHAEAWATHAGVLEALAEVSTVNAVSTYGVNWDGVGALAAGAAHAGMNTETSALAAAAAAKVQPVLDSAANYSQTVAMMVTAEQAVANRVEEAADEQINPWVLWSLTPRITELNLEYFGYMWPNNAGRGAAYGAGLRAAVSAMLTPSVPAVSGASPAAAAAAAAAVAESAALSGVGAALQAAEQAAMAVVSPAAAPAAALGAVSPVSSVSSAPAVAAAPPAPPTATVQHVAPALPAQPMTPTQVGMFAQPPSAALLAAPVAANPALADAPPAQPMTPRPAPVAGAVPAAPGVTSFIRPAEPFSPPPPTAGRASGVRPGMLDAAALRGPVATMPLTTTATSTLASAEPLAYVHPEQPQSTVSPTPPQQPPLNTGDTAHTLNPPHLLTPPQPPQPPRPAAPNSGPPPGPATGSGGPDGSGGPGARMLGAGPGGAPQAPPVPIPLDPPTPSPAPVDQMTKDQALAELNIVNAAINGQIDKWKPVMSAAEAAQYNATNAALATRQAALIKRLEELGVPVERLPPNVKAPITEPPPPSPPDTPGAQPQPGVSSGPSIADQATQIGEEIKALPKGSGQLQNLADKVTGLHLDQEQAVEATDIAAKTAFGETGGIANLPDGTKVVLPKYLPQGVAMVVHPDGSVTVFRGDLNEFLPYLGN